MTTSVSEFSALTDAVGDPKVATELIQDLWDRGYQLTPRQPFVMTSVWTRDPEKPEFLIRERQKTVSEVYDELVAIVGREGPGHNEYLSLMPNDPTSDWPQGRIAVFSVVGGSEGDYTHVEVHIGDERRLMILGKTFDGTDESWAFARRVADIFQAGE